MKNIILVLLVSFSSSVVTYAQGFTDIDAGLTGLHWSDVSWGDYDSDGDLDLICCGFDDLGGSNTIIYRNDNNTPILHLNHHRTLFLKLLIMKCH